jgi:hypothetical protein
MSWIRNTAKIKASRETVPLSQDEDADNRTERTWGNIELRTRYSHVDLIHMIGGADIERGTVTRDGCTTARRQGVRFVPLLAAIFFLVQYLFLPLFNGLCFWASQIR